MTVESDPRRLWTIDEVAAYFRVSRRTVQRWISAGHLHALHPGRAPRITEAEVNRLAGVDLEPGDAPRTMPPEPGANVRPIGG